MTTERDHFTAATGPDGNIYAFGGAGASAEMYSVTNDTWSAIPDWPAPGEDPMDRPPERA